MIRRNSLEVILLCDVVHSSVISCFVRVSSAVSAPFSVEPRNLDALIGLASSIIAALRRDCCCSKKGDGDGYNECSEISLLVSRCPNISKLVVESSSQSLCIM